MISIDLKTLFLDFTLTNIISLVFIYMLWLQNKNRYKGLQLIFTCYALNLISIILIFLRGSITDFSSIILANTLSLYGIYCAYLGLEKFVGIKQKQRIIYPYFIVFVAIESYFTWIDSNMAARNANLAFGYIILCFLSARLLMYKVPVHLSSLTRQTAYVYIFFLLVNLIRFADQSIVALNESIYHAVLTKFDLNILLIYQISLLTLSFIIIHMINKRLKNDILHEEQKLRLAFHTVPYAILITRKTDGLILELNDGFEQITGYERNLAIGKSSAEINIWVNYSQRSIVLTRLEKNELIHDMEVLFRKKSGEILTGQLSCINIDYENTECILSVVNDVTEAKKIENEIKLSRDILKNLLLNQQNEYENEKINLASQIDNSLNQSLAALRLNLGMLKRKIKSENNIKSDEVFDLVETTYQQTGLTIERSLSLMNSLRNEVLYLFGFVEAINFAVDELRKKKNIRCNFVTNADKIDIEKNRSFALFNIFQDILKVILTNNPPSRIDIQLNVKNKMLTMIISENGKNFDDYLLTDQQNPTIDIIKEKLALLNGVITFHSNSNEFSVINIELSL